MPVSLPFILIVAATIVVGSVNFCHHQYDVHQFCHGVMMLRDSPSIFTVLLLIVVVIFIMNIVGGGGGGGGGDGGDDGCMCMRIHAHS